MVFGFLATLGKIGCWINKLPVAGDLPFISFFFFWQNSPGAMSYWSKQPPWNSLLLLTVAGLHRLQFPARKLSEGCALSPLLWVWSPGKARMV